MKILIHPDGKRRVVFLRLRDGQFTFEEQYYSDEPLELCWIPPKMPSVAICNSLDIAQREAQGRIPWLKDLCTK